jgi:hypothetical protein
MNLATTLTPLERNVDDLLRFENFDLYRAQSAATVAGHPAPFPQRAPLSLDGVRADFDKLFGVAR